MRTTRFFTRVSLAAIALVVVTSAVLAGSDTASAATQTMTHPFVGSTAPLNVFTITGLCDPCIPDELHSGPGEFALGATVSGDIDLAWNASTSTDATYSPGLIRQGSTLDMSDKLTTLPGTVTAQYTLSGTVGIFNDPVGHAGTDPNDFSPIGGESFSLSHTFNQPIACAMPLPGDSPRTCSRSDTVTLFTAPFVIVDLTFRIRLDTTVTVDGTGVVTLRKAVINGGPAIPDQTITFGGASPSTKADPFFISCTQPVGEKLGYSLTGTHWSADQALDHTATLNALVELPIVGTDLFDSDIISVSAPTAHFSTMTLNAPDQALTLDPVQADATPPTIGSVGGPYTGTEGTPIQFNATASDNCGPPTLRWDFSDGGVAFGPNPKHTFADNGTYSALLTATDVTGLTTTATFSIDVSNVDPTVDGGPDKASPWGLPVAFHANGADVGAVDNGSLLYSWDFGDPNSLIGAAGQDVSHVYSMPGVYTATVTVHDKDGASGTDTVQVTVSKRATTLVYTGPVQSLPNKRISPTATLTDSLGRPVVGAIVTFTVGSQTATGVTNGSGIATASLLLNQKNGSYAVNASFAGDAKYFTSSAAAGTFKIGNK